MRRQSVNACRNFYSGVEISTASRQIGIGDVLLNHAVPGQKADKVKEMQVRGLRVGIAIGAVIRNEVMQSKLQKGER